MTESMPKIESNIPVPPHFGKWVDLIQHMKWGDSVEVLAKQRSCMASAMHRFKIKCVTRKTTDGKVRVWKVK